LEGEIWRNFARKYQRQSSLFVVDHSSEKGAQIRKEKGAILANKQEELRAKCLAQIVSNLPANQLI